MGNSSSSKSPAVKSPARDFFVILACAIVLSIGFVQWMKSSLTSTIPGGLDVGEPAPSVRASVWVNGAGPTPEDLQGEVYVVVAWATWCGPCAREAPHLVDVYQQVHDRGVQFYGLASQEEALQPQIEAWLRDFDIPWPNGFGAEALETLRGFEADVIPGVWVVDREGRVVWNLAEEHRESLEEAIDRALATR